MIDETGTIKEGNATVGQVQIVRNEDGGKRVQLYNSKGIFLCDCPFEGDDDIGFAIGLGMYRAYVAAWMNCEISISKSVNQALYGKKDLEIG